MRASNTSVFDFLLDHSSQIVSTLAFLEASRAAARPTPFRDLGRYYCASIRFTDAAA
jgi:hypothetical protein